jgi:effector-binding domain-containing protein
MKKSFLVFILVAISFLLWGQKDREFEPLNVEREAPFKFVSQEFSGSVEQVDDFMKEFMKNFFDQQLIPNGHPMALFHNEPKSAEDRNVKFEIGFPVGTRDDLNVRPPLKVQDIQLPAVMRHVHTGPYTELFGVYSKLKGMVRQGCCGWSRGFTIHRFLNNPEYVKPEEIKTEVLIPIETGPGFEANKPRVKTGQSMDYTIMYKSYRGSVDQIGSFVEDFLRLFFGQNRTPSGQPMIIFPDIPRSPKDRNIRMDIGIPIPGKDPGGIRYYREGRDIQPASGIRGRRDESSALKTKRLKMNNFASLDHTGPYVKLFDTHKEMVQELNRYSYQTDSGQAILILMNNPTVVNPEEIKAKIIIPGRR